MPTYIIKLADKYLLYSTIVDAPITYGMSKEELIEYLKEEGTDRLIEDRLARVDKIGTSSRLDSSAEETIEFNKAGPGESNLSVEEFIKTYITEIEE